MYICWGTKPYGTCDNVPGLFHVATWFFHVNYLPLFPTASHIVLGKSGDQYHVIKIPLSVKSILLAWCRTALFLAGTVVTLLAVVALADPRSAPARDYGPMNLLALSLGAIGLFALFMIYPRRKLPSYDRACHLATIVSLNDTGWAALNVLYRKDPFDRPLNFQQPAAS